MKIIYQYTESIASQKSNGDEVSWDAADSLVEGVRNFHIDDQLTSDKYSKDSFVRTLAGRDLTVGYLQKSGFTNPIYVAEKAELDMKMPNAKVQDLRSYLCSAFWWNK